MLRKMQYLLVLALLSGLASADQITLKNGDKISGKVVKSDGPNDLVFQSVQKGLPMRDNNVLIRYIKPAGVRWRCRG